MRRLITEGARLPIADGKASTKPPPFCLIDRRAACNAALATPRLRYFLITAKQVILHNGFFSFSGASPRYFRLLSMRGSSLPRAILAPSHRLAVMVHQNSMGTSPLDERSFFTPVPHTLFTPGA